MFEFNWRIFVTSDLLAKINSFADIDNSLDDVQSVLEKILSNVGGLPYTKVQYNSADRTRIAESLLHEAIKHTLKTLSHSPYDPGFYLVDSASDAFEKEIAFIEKVGLNRATAKELAALPRIGRNLAKRIINERMVGGQFKSLDDFKSRVRGIGQRVLQDINYAIRIDAPNERLEELVHIHDNFEQDFQNLISIQRGKTKAERLKAALDMIATVCASNPHPAIDNHVIRDLSTSMLELQIQSEWISVLWGSDYWRKLPELLKTSERSILVCMFHIAAPAVSHPTYKILEALVTAHRAGVSIKVLLDNDKSTDPYRSSVINAPAKDFLEQQGISCRFDSEDTLLHSKFVIIDNKLLILGSHNWTAGSYFHFDDLSIIVKSKALAKELATRFDQLWSNADL